LQVSREADVFSLFQDSLSAHSIVKVLSHGFGPCQTFFNSYQVAVQKMSDMFADGTVTLLEAHPSILKIRSYVLRDFFQCRKCRPRLLVMHHIPYLTAPIATAALRCGGLQINPHRDDEGNRTRF
jgi:hypothetical protein